MSQDELIEWLEELSKERRQAASQFLEDPDDEIDAAEAEILDELPDEEEWSQWLDHEGASPGLGQRAVDDAPPPADDDTPSDLVAFEQSDAVLPADAIDWLEEITADNSQVKLPDITDYQPPHSPPRNLSDLIAAEDVEDPLKWLDNLAQQRADSSSSVKVEAEFDEELNFPQDFPDDFDEEYEDDEALDDLEDESLFSPRADQTINFLQSLLGLPDQEMEKYSTQSMAPVPEFLQPSAGSSIPEAEQLVTAVAAAAITETSDSFTEAFLLQEQREDLEAWYASRLRAIAGAGARQKPATEESSPLPSETAAARFGRRHQFSASQSQRRRVERGIARL